MKSPPARVLVVDDEPGVRTSVRRGLQIQGYEVEVAADGQEGVEKARSWKPDVILMDLAMPTMGGISAIHLIRTWSTVPIIVLSVMGEESEKVRALDSGADDYLTKPFGMQELSARIRAALRRQAPVEEGRTYEVGQVRVDTATRQVTVAGTDVHLTPTEYELLKQLVDNAGRVLTHRRLLERVWGAEYTEQVHYLRPVVTALRKKLGHHLIQTEPGVGYRLRVPYT
jgi:two-component system KDP operon response regulator KdpE